MNVGLRMKPSETSTLIGYFLKTFHSEPLEDVYYWEEMK